MEFYEISWEEFKEDLKGFSSYLRQFFFWEQNKHISPTYLFPLPRGGWLLYWLLCYIDNSLIATNQIEYAKIILDDICDTGKTLLDPHYINLPKVVMYQRLIPDMPEVPQLHAFRRIASYDYILLPFENKEQVLQQTTFRTGDKAL